MEESRKSLVDSSGTFVGSSNFPLKRLVTIANGDDADYKGLPLLNELAVSISKRGWKISVAGKWSPEVRARYGNLEFLGLMAHEELFEYLSKEASVGIIA